jgi:hypothetical protein
MENSISANYSSKPRARGTLAAQLRALSEFANLRDEDVEKLRTKYPNFLVSKALTEDGWIEGVVHRLGGSGSRLISRRALMIAETIRKLQPTPALRTRDMLRLIWKGDSDANDYLKVLLSGSRTQFNWKRGELVYEPQNELEQAIYALFRNSRLARVCESTDCPAPFFIAKRKSQRYCGPECASVYQKQWKRRWWKDKGASRRKKQRMAKGLLKKGGGNGYL